MGREFTDRKYTVSFKKKIRFLTYRYPLRRGFPERVFAQPGRDCSWSWRDLTDHQRELDRANLQAETVSSRRATFISVSLR